ncbi:hypothetical protein GWI33_015399 [Rhynchophorus ferrugineus]|uniref:NACHT domain-containing protein n=1 Tax=Rhynchophorus ferrugineus TaxID=354439 RepID=A0A834M851_RHYFE|nr:hypothetical protein GWI33_015399 [Rhynchophorus ferrugineus]
MVDEANLMCETLKILLDSTRAEKGKFSELAKKILKLKGIFLTNDKYDELTKVFALFVETKVTDKLYLARRNELYSACESLLRNIVDIVNEAHCKLNSYQDSGSSQYTLLEEEISTIDKHKTQYIALKTMIWNCTNLIDLHNKISSFPDIANKLQAKDTKNLDLGGIQKKLSTILEKNITDCVMLELAGNEHKLATYIQQFLEKFRLVTCYPDVDKLNILLKRELGKKFAFINADLITDSFQKQMLDWFKEYNKGKSDFLSSNQGRAFFKSIGSHITSLMTAGLNEAYPAKLKSFNLQFKTTDLNQIFPSSKNILHIITESTKLSAIKLLQVIDESQLYDSRDSFIFLPLSGFVSREIQKLVVSSFCAPNRHDLLVIECQKHIKLTTFPYINEFIEDIARVLRQNVKKKFILISQNGCDNIVDELVTFGCTRTHVVEDKNTFCQLKEECQENVLNRTIELQNAIVPLHQMIGLQSACDILNESALEGILLSSIQIGETDSFKSSYFVPEYYQQRHLHLQSLNYSVFEVNSAKFYVTNMEHTEYVKTHYHQLWSYIYKYSENIIQAKQNDDHEKVFQKLCNDNPDFLIYWLHHNNGKLYWKRSNNGFKNGMSAISIIQEHIIDNLTSSGNGFYHEENIKFSEKMVVVANNPGVGKSTFLTSMANIMKRLHKNWWICRISLNDYVFNRKYLPPTDSRLYTKNLEEIVDSLTSDQAVDFLADMVIPPNPQTLHRDFQREIFKLGLRNHDNVHPHLVLLFDGFDEISPVYKTKTITLLKALSATDIMQIWVTTRLHEKYSLEEAFHCVAYVLYPLNENQQINFLTNFWSYSLAQKSISDEDIVTYGNNLNIDIEYIKKCYDGNELSPVLELETFAENLINEWKMSASDEQKSFTHNPLHLKMIAEIVFLKNFEMTRQIGLVELFKTFLDLKFDIFYREKQILGHSVGALEVREDHSEPLRQKHRLLAFREVYPDVTDELEDPVGANDTSSLTRAGLLIRFGTRLTFIHRNFAEYLLVEYLTLTLNQVLTQKILFERIFSENKPSFIALIFNEFVCKNSLDICLTEPTIELIKNLAGVRYADIFLHHLYYGGFDNTLIFVLKALKHYPDIQEQVLLKPGIYGKFVMYDITHNSTRGRSLQEQESAIKIYLDYLADQPNILVKIFTSRYREMDVLLGNQEPEVTCLQVALFTTGTEKIFELFMDSIRNSKSHFREVLFKNGITSTDTILHFGCRFAYTKLHLLLRLLAPSNSEDRFVDILNDLILAKDSIGRTALHYLSFNRRPTLINTFISWVKDISENTLINLLSSVDNRRINPLDMAIYIDDSNTSRAFLDSLNINLSQEQFNALVFRNGLERSILFKAVIQGKTNSMITILEWLKERYAADGQNNIRVITEMLKERHDICGRTSITIASARNFSQTLEKLFYWIRDVCENATEGILFQLLSMKDNDGKTILHEATLFGTQSLSLLIQFITQHFSCYDLAEILLSKSNANKTALDLAKTSETKELLWSCIYIIFQTVIKLSNITHVSDYPVKFNETQLTVLEEIAHTHFQGNNERIIEAIDTVKCMMGFHCSSTMESPSTSTSIRHLSLPP